jgi:hypothetical protein
MKYEKSIWNQALNYPLKTTSIKPRRKHINQKVAVKGGIYSEI